MSQIKWLAGAGNDFKHQIIISFLITSFTNKFNLKTYKNYFAVPEINLKPNSSKIPDITVFKKNRHQYSPIVLIEICNSKELKNDINKLNDLMITLDTVKECFVINKDDDTIYRIYRKKDLKPSITRQSNTCKTFKLNLSQIIQKLPV